MQDANLFFRKKGYLAGPHARREDVHPFEELVAQRNKANWLLL
ncbi:MAG: hypothetical protein QXT10_06075 [Candidatus Bathyarchaeia archaeon]